jgi:adenylate cyclase
MTADETPTVIDLAHEPRFGLGGVEVRPSTRELLAEGQSEALEPRVMQVLVALARQRGQVVSRDSLIASCWGGRAVGEDAISRCIQAIRKLAEAHGGFTITTVARVGYRLDESAPPLAQPALPTATLAVLAFDNLSGDPEQEYFADGMVEEIVAALSRFRSIFVIASGSSLSLKGQAITPQDAGLRLGVRYLLQGSVRKAGNRVRIAVKLIDTNDGAQVWVDRFEDTLEDVFALQDRVALAVAGVIAPTVRQAEVRHASERPTENPTSSDLYLRALASPIIETAEALQKALDLLDRAIALDPRYAPALIRAAMGYRNRYQFGWSDDPEADRRHAVDLAHRALAAAKNDADVLASAASVLGRLGGDPGAAIALLDRALALNPGSSWAWFTSGRLRVNMGDAERGAEHIETAMRLDPLSPARASQLQNLGLARFAQGRFKEALALFQEGAQLRSGAWQIQFFLAACQGQLGPGPAAREALARARKLNPRLDLEKFAGQSLLNDAQRQLFLDGIAAAEGDPRHDGSASAR